VRSTRQLSVVAASKPCECSAFACGEAEHECPDESGNLELAVAFDHAEFLGVLFERNSEGNSVVSRRIIRDEEVWLYTDSTSSFLSKRSLDKLPQYSDSSPN